MKRAMSICPSRVWRRGSMNGSMGIWLGKQLLAQRDMITTEHVGAGGGAIQMSMRPDLSKLSDEELERLLEIARKMAAAEKSE